MTSRKNVVKPKSVNLAVLLEEMDKKFDLMLEGNVAVGKELKDFRHEMAEFRKETDFKFKVLGDELGGLGKRFDSFEVKTEGNFKAIMEYLSRLDDEIQELKHQFAGRPELKRVLSLEQRVAHLELVVKKFYSKN